jgi:Sigma-70 region 2
LRAPISTGTDTANHASSSVTGADTPDPDEPKQPCECFGVNENVENDLAGLPPAAQAPRGDAEDAERAVTALYREHALGLTRLAFLVLGDRHAAEDVVQDAFCGLYRAWDRLPAHDNVLGSQES